MASRTPGRTSIRKAARKGERNASAAAQTPRLHARVDAFCRLAQANARFEKRNVMSRERAPLRDDVDLEALSKAQGNEYAKIRGRAPALAHRRFRGDHARNACRALQFACR